MPPKATTATATETAVTPTETATTATATETAVTPAETITAAVQPPPEPVRGRALVDLPQFGLKCGEYGTVPADVASGLSRGGQFDPRAPWPGE